jgi:hypothetical protein
VIGDEMAYPRVKKQEVQRLIGGGLQVDLPLDEIVAEVREKYHLYYIIPGGASHGTDQEVLGFWTRLLGESSVLHLETPGETSECIAVTIGVGEGAITTDQASQRLQSRGVVGRTIDRLTDALRGIVPGAGATVRSDRPRRL